MRMSDKLTSIEAVDSHNLEAPTTELENQRDPGIAVSIFVPLTLHLCLAI